MARLAAVISFILSDLLKHLFLYHNTLGRPGQRIFLYL